MITNVARHMGNKVTCVSLVQIEKQNMTVKPVNLSFISSSTVVSESFDLILILQSETKK